MKIVKTITVKVVDLKANLFVRKELDSDHVLFLADLIAGGHEMTHRIKVTEDFVIIDGRHRKEAYELNQVKEIKVDVVRIDDEVEMISEAYKANTGGAKPPTIADTEHTIGLLLEKGQSMKAIGELLGLPSSIARKYATEVKSRMGRAKMQRAADAVTDGGLTISKAAEQYDVDPEILKQTLSGHRRRNSKAGGVVDVQRTLTKTYKGVSSKNAALLRKIIEKYEDGDVNKKQAEEIFNHLDQLLKRSSKAVAEWRSRFNAISGGVGKFDKVA